MVGIETFARALDRAVSEGVRLRPSEEYAGRFDVRSGTDHSVWYLGVSIHECGCKAGRKGVLCKHRALVAYVTMRVDELVGRVRVNPVFAEETYREVLVA
jgi:hypothetical protein